jgi:uncharacterized protein DUF4242
MVPMCMPIFLDVHKVPFTEANLRELCQSPPDEFGVLHVNLFYNKEAKICFCLLHAPDLDAVEKHHKKVNIECEWITEVTNIVNEGYIENQIRRANEKSSSATITAPQ